MTHRGAECEKFSRTGVLQALCALNDTIKGQQPLLVSCSDAPWLGPDDRRAARHLLEALIDHRRRVRVLIRLWRSLGPSEALSASLVRETAEVIDENHYFLPHVERWRVVAVDHVAAEREEFWRAMLELAQHNLSATAVVGDGVCTHPTVPHETVPDHRARSA